MRTDLGFTHLTLVPGQPTRVAIEVTNTASVIDGVTAIVDGLDPDWIRLDEPLVRLFPEASGEVTFTIDVPKDCPAGDYLVVVRIVSTLSADRQSVQDFWATVDPIQAGRIDVVPRILTKGAKGVLTTTVTNTGNTPTTFRLGAIDATGEVDCTVDPPELPVGLGDRADAVVALRGPRPWFGQIVSRSIVITAVADDVELTAVATFNQKPRISRGLMTIVTLAAIIALWALMFVFVIGFLRDQTPPVKAAATAFAGGEQSVPIGKIAATASGTVTSSTEGEGLPGVAVQAYRVPADGPPELFAEVATDEDGVFAFTSLLPGDYQLKFVAAGFGEQWYTSEPGAEPSILALAPAGEQGGLDIVLVGAAGSFRGVIDTSGGDAASGNFVVSATLIDPDADPPPEPIPGTVNPDGTYELGDLPAPNDYRVRIEDLDGNYATQEFVISVAAGETKQLNPVVPSASAGALGGVVTDGSGNRLGGVAVTVRNGDFLLEGVTPTTGDTGSFRFIGLPTPATYIVTFALEGYTGQTIALELGPGVVDDTLSAVLIAGLGTVNGSVTDSAGNPLGAAIVTIEGRGFTAATASLTDQGSTGGVGSFFLTGVPVPGSYTITCVLEGYEPVTIPAVFGETGGPLAPRIVLAPIEGRITGTVSSSAGGGIADATVKLSSGRTDRIRTTATSSAPLGDFSFAAVPPGAYTLQVSAEGFAPFVRLVRIGVGGAVDADITLTPVAAPSTFAPAPSLTVTQSVDLRTVARPGSLSYTIQVSNTGNIDLTGPVVENSLAGASSLTAGDVNANSVIDVGEVWVYSATYRVTQADIDAGTALLNTARVVTVEVPGPSTATVSTGIVQNPALSAVQSASPSPVVTTGPLSFGLTVTNTGNVGLTGVTVENDLAGPSALTAGDANSNGVIDAGEAWVYTATFQVTQAQVEAGAPLVNTASVTTTQVPGPITATSTVNIAQARAVALTNEVVPATYSIFDEGAFEYTITVDNTGNVGLANVVLSVEYTYTGLATPPPAVPLPAPTGDNDADGVLDVDETWVYLITRFPVSTDFAATAVVSTATVTADGLAAASTAVATSVNTGPIG